jgi:hypothetical protein
MTPLDIAAYERLEDSVLDCLPESFFAAAKVTGQLYVGIPRINFWRAVL